jgi:hypothetical protein
MLVSSRKERVLLRIFWSRVLRRIFAPKMEHGTGAFRKCNDEMIYNVLSLILL